MPFWWKKKKEKLGMEKFRYRRRFNRYKGQKKKKSFTGDEIERTPRRRRRQTIQGKKEKKKNSY